MSTIKVDTLQTRAGSTAAVTGAGFVATDQIRGNTAANSVTVVAEGGTNTTNLQQGLCKSWVKFDSDFSADNSFNVSGITDVAAGIGDIAYASNMNDTAPAVCTNALVTSEAASNSGSMAYNFATASHRNLSVSNGVNTDENRRCSIVMGDLA
jgi:hypothetical protein